MTFQVTLTQDVIQVDPSQAVPLDFTITLNEGEPDTFEISVEGLDPEWLAIPEGTVTLSAGETKHEKVYVKPPRTSESPAGMYPFILRVRSLTSGDVQSANATVEIKPFHALSLDVAPKKGLVTPVRNAVDFKVTVMNLGNTPEELQLFAADTDDQCEFSFDQPNITVGGGHERSVTVTARTRHRPLLANSRLFGFTVTARSAKSTHSAVHAQGQVEQRALVAPGAFFVFMLLALMMFAWIWSYPKPPSVENLVLSATQVEIGQTVKIDFQASNAKAVDVYVDGQMIKTVLGAQGSADFTPTEARKYEISAQARNGGRMSQFAKMELSVILPPPTPSPRILTFATNKRDVNVGETVILSYSINDAVTKLMLEPKDVALDPTVRSFQKEVEVTQEGSNEFTLIAFNAKGEHVERKVIVRGVRGSKARIIVFKSDVASLEPGGGMISLTWQVTNAVRVELSHEGQTVTLDTTDGITALQVLKTTKFVLTVYDADGLTQTKEIEVKVKEPEKPVGRPPEENPDQPPIAPTTDAGAPR